MYCKNCGKEAPGSTRFCPECGADMLSVSDAQPKTEKPKKKKTWLFILIAVVVVIGIIAAAGGGNDESKPDSQPEAVADAGENAENGGEAGKTDETSQGTYKVGDTLDANGLMITISEAGIWDGYDQYFPPKDGYKILRMKVDIKNESDSDKFVNSYDFSCYVNNQPTEEYIWNSDDELTFGSISAGREASGYVYYQIPADADSAEIEYETNYWTDKKAIFELDF